MTVIFNSMVNQALLHPQEVEVYYIIPTIRRYLAICMKEHGLKQREIAKILNIKEAAVSQYISNKRGSKLKFSRFIEDSIRESSSKIKDNFSLITETQRILKLIRESGELCSFHKKLSPVPTNCNPLKTGCLPYHESH